MNTLFVFAAHNTAAALVFAVFVYGVTRAWRNPPVAHVLWLLVLLRLVAAAHPAHQLASLLATRPDAGWHPDNPGRVNESRHRGLNLSLDSSICPRLERRPVSRQRA